MPNSYFALGIITLVTLLGDYFLKIASGKSQGMATGWFAAGLVTYALLAIGWFFQMKSNSLATIGVMFSASISFLLTALGYFVFKEHLACARRLAFHWRCSRSW